jgi:N-acetyl-gamma-glutamyl-phosphate reductase
MKHTVFVDGQEGTTGLKIHDRLSVRNDIEILAIDPEKRKDPEAKKALMNLADIVFFCLPDAAARESAVLVTNPAVKVIDASTAFRTDPAWAYGLPELDKNQRNVIRASTRVSVPGCFATGFVLAVHPLVAMGIISDDYPVTCHAVSGYSGGGKKLIAAFETENRDYPGINAPKHYSLGLSHKHVPEMQKRAGLSMPPLFTPIVANYFQGMAVALPLHKRLMKKPMNAREIHGLLEAYYAGELFVKVIPFDSGAWLENGYFNAMGANDTNRLDLFVFGQEDIVFVMARLDNLGKGASGAAVQNMNILLGADEGTGLTG